MTKKTFNFGKIDYMGRGKKISPVTVEVELKPNKNGLPVFTISTHIWNARKSDCYAMGGGSYMMKELGRVPENNALFQELKGLSKYHLNDTHAGTKAQESALKKAGFTGRNYDYSKACEYLKRVGLYEVTLTPTERKYNPEYAGKPYKYGHGWLYHPIPAADLAKIRRIINGTTTTPAKKTVPAPFGL